MARGGIKRTFKEGRCPGTVLPCTRCGETKDEKEFYFNHAHFRYDSQCIKCKKKMELGRPKRSTYIPKTNTYKLKAEKEIKPDSALTIEHAKKIIKIGDSIMVRDLIMKIVKITTYGADTLTVNGHREIRESFLWIDLLTAIKEKRVIYSA